MPTVADYALIAAEASPPAASGGGLILPSVARRKRWSTPNFGARVDFSHKYAPFDGVIFGLNGGARSLQGLQTFSDYTSATPSVPFDEPLTPGAFGPAWGTMSSTVGCTWRASIQRGLLPGVSTWVWVGRRTGTPPSYAGLICGRFANGSGLICNNSANIASNANDDPSRYGAAGVGLPALGEWVTVQCAFDYTQTRWFVGGSVPQFQTQTIGAPLPGWVLNPANHYLSVSSDKGNGTRSFPSEVLGAFVIPRPLSYAEMRELDADPFQFLTSPSRSWGVPVGAASSAPVGAFGGVRAALADLFLVAGLKGGLGSLRAALGETNRAAGAKGTTGGARIAAGATERPAGLKALTASVRAALGLAVRGGGSKDISGVVAFGGATVAVGQTARVAGSKGGLGTSSPDIGVTVRSVGFKAGSGGARPSPAFTSRAAGTKAATGGARIAPGLAVRDGGTKATNGLVRAVLGLVATVRRRTTVGLVACIEMTGHEVAEIRMNAEEC